MLPSHAHPTAFDSSQILWILRVALGVVFLTGGAKLAMPALFGVADIETLANMYVDPTKGWIAPYFAHRITAGFGLEIGTFLQLQGWLEILLGLCMVIGVFTPMVAVMLGLMFWSFTVATPGLGQIRLSRDLALMGCSFAVALSGATAWSIDRWRQQPDGFNERKDLILIILRLSITLTLVISAIFSGGVLNNPLNTTLPTLLVLILGLALGVGLQPRWVTAAVGLWLLAVVIGTLYSKGWLLGLDSVKREVGLLAAAIVYWKAGPDRWGWPRPHLLNCRAAGELLLNYLEDKLARSDRRAFERHIADCKNCWRFLDSYQKTIELGRSLKEDDIPEEMAGRLQSFLRDHVSN